IGPACACARARGRANSSIQAMADHRIAELREREGHQVTLSRRRVLTRARATPCGFATARLTSTLPFPIKRPGGPVSTETLQHVALFEKCRTFLPKAREVQAAGLHAWYKPISRSEDTVVIIEGKERIMMGSNNYLGLTHHPDVLAAAKAALDRYGSGCTGSRLLNGTLDLHEQLEAELAEFFGKEACAGLAQDLPEARRGPGDRRRARGGRARPQRRRHRGSLRDCRRGGADRRHVLEVTGVHRRLPGRARGRDHLPALQRAAPRVHGGPAARQHRGGAGRATRHATRAGAP